jgi:hypothetical protein
VYRIQVAVSIMVATAAESADGDLIPVLVPHGRRCRVTWLVAQAPGLVWLTTHPPPHRQSFFDGIAKDEACAGAGAAEQDLEPELSASPPLIAYSIQLTADIRYKMGRVCAGDTEGCFCALTQALQSKITSQSQRLGVFGSMLGDKAAEVTAMAQQSFGDISLPSAFTSALPQLAGERGGAGGTTASGLLSSFRGNFQGGS